MSTESDRPNTGALGTIVAVGALTVIGVTFAVTALVRSELAQEETTKGTNANLRVYRDLTASWQAELNAAPTWVDKEQQLVTVPIDRAKELVLAEHLEDRPAQQPPADGEQTAREEEGDQRADDRIGPSDGPEAVTPEEARGQATPGKAPTKPEEPQTPGPKQPGAAGQATPSPKEQVPLKPAPKGGGAPPSSSPGAPPPAQPRPQPPSQEQGR